MKNAWRSGVIFTAINFFTLIIGFGFQIVVSRQLKGHPGEFGLVQTAIAFIGLLGLPLAIATQAVTHYIARFHFSSESERLQGLLTGCRKFLLHITIVGSLAAVVLVKPLGDFLHIPRLSLTLVALICVLAGFWSAFITALCQGLGWFKRLALVGLLAAVLRFAFGVTATRLSPLAEWAVLASGIMLTANLVLLFWKKEFPRKTTVTASPWSREMVHFLVVSTACVIGSSFFSQYDLFVANRYFGHSEVDNYANAGLLARQIPVLVGPLLQVLFTHRSSRLHHHDHDLRELMKLLGLYALGLLINAAGLYLLKSVGLGLLNHNNPEAAGMIAPFAVTMVFVGLIQAIGMWALASHWLRISLLYGVLGLGYWVFLLVVGKTPEALLHAMPFAAGIAFAILFGFWFRAMRRHLPAPAIQPSAGK
jgi:hypothetical protein